MTRPWRLLLALLLTVGLSGPSVAQIQPNPSTTTPTPPSGACPRGMLVTWTGTAYQCQKVYVSGIIYVVQLPWPCLLGDTDVTGGQPSFSPGGLGVGTIGVSPPAMPTVGSGYRVCLSS